MAYTASKLVAIAIGELGYHEKASNVNLDNKTANAGDRNFTKYARDLAEAGYYQASKQGYEWCDMFHDWCHLQAAGGDAKLAQDVICQTGPYGAGCTYSMQYYGQQGRLDMDPKVGDQIFFRYSGNSGAEHTGIVISVSDMQVVTIEGNSNNQVQKNTYNRTDKRIVGYGHPKYDDEVEKNENIPIRGIDVSKWQGEIDWDKVAADGIRFAMIRLGYGSRSGEDCHVDNFFERNVFNAVNAGIDVGCYFYSYAISLEAVKKEAEFVVGVLEKYKSAFTYPIALDVEDKTQSGLGKTMLTDMVIAFGDATEKAGFYFTIYASLSWFRNYLDDKRLSRFDHWLAQWADAPSYSGEFGLWQSSSTGEANGIDGHVDTDIAYKDYPMVIRSKKLNGFTSETQKPIAPKPQPETYTQTYMTITLPEIGHGSTGSFVESVQNLLIAKGYTVGGDLRDGREVGDGEFGDATEKAVKEFQKTKGLTADGIVGANTMSALLN